MDEVRNGTLHVVVDQLELWVVVQALARIEKRVAHCVPVELEVALNSVHLLGLDPISVGRALHQRFVSQGLILWLVRNLVQQISGFSQGFSAPISLLQLVPCNPGNDQVPELVEGSRLVDESQANCRYYS